MLAVLVTCIGLALAPTDLRIVREISTLLIDVRLSDVIELPNVRPLES